MAELAPKDVIASLRRPKQIYTEGFLDDPLKFDTDKRLEVETLLRELNEITMVERDQAEFAVIDIGADGEEYYPVPMYTLDYNRSDVERKVNKRITELNTE